VKRYERARVDRLYRLVSYFTGGEFNRGRMTALDLIEQTYKSSNRRLTS